MRRLRICLISPGHLSTNPRLLKEARTLTSAGHAVSIVCGCYTSWGKTTDAQLIDPAWHVEQVAFGPVEASRRVYLTQTVRRQLARKLAAFNVTAPRVVEAAHAPAVPELIRKAVQIPAHLYIAHYVAALPAAALAAKANGALYAFDAEDYHQGDLPQTPEHQLDRDIIRSIEQRYLLGAMYVTAASSMIADAYADTYRIVRPNVVLNVFPKINAPAAPTPCGTAIPGPSLYWFSQTIGPGRGLECAIRAIGHSRTGAHLYLRGALAADYKSELCNLAHSVGVKDRVHFLTPVNPCELERSGAVYDLGYSGETGFSINNKLALGNKLFSYLLSGIPSIASDIAAHRAFAPNVGSAMTIFPVNDAVALANAIDSYLLKPGLFQESRVRAWRLAQENYNWDNEQHKFLSLVSARFAESSH